MGFRTKLQNWLDRGNKPVDHDVEKKVGMREVPAWIASTRDSRREEITMTFNITFAEGGYIISFNRWIAKDDKNVGGVYVRGEDCDLGKEIEKLFTIEKLRG